MTLHRMLSCGIYHEVFNAAFAKLSIDEQSRMYNVAQRMWITHVLRYRIDIKDRFMGPDEVWQLELFDIPALEVYLLFTCIDTLAQKKHVKFPDWLRDKVSKDQDLRLQSINKLYTRYEEECGVGSNLRRLLNRLPEPTKEWLSQNIKIRKINNKVFEETEVDDDQVQIETQDSPIILKELYEYFYVIKRNSFTHGGKSIQTYVSDDIVIGERWRFTPSTDYYRKDKRYTYCLLFKEGLDEATILRVIIHSIALQQIGIDVYSSVIDKFLTTQARFCAMHGFIDDIQQNMLYLRLLHTFDVNGRSEFHDHICYAGIPHLHSRWSEALIGRFYATQDNALESGLRHVVIAYLNNITTINALISEFNTEHPPPRREGSFTEYAQAVKEFLDKWLHIPLFNEVTELPSRVEISNLELLARDPCYT